jgi:hypothetical protein
MLFLSNSSSKLGRAILTTPVWIRVKLNSHQYMEILDGKFPYINANASIYGRMKHRLLVLYLGISLLISNNSSLFYMLYKVTVNQEPDSNVVFITVIFLDTER